MMSAPAPYPMVQSSAPAIDDHEIITRTPSICVDYLSHNWTDEDVWSSWKAMTKRKNEIANGVRLENASWRTWAKQRGKLKTISPETLNWLKDSDVTWLYGPLHEHAEPVPPPKQATARERLGLEDSVRTKSILKHRTISEMLTTPGLNAASPSVETPPIGSTAGSREGSDSESEKQTIGRPGMHVTNSETALTNLNRRRAGGSPPASERLFRNLSSSGDKNDGLAQSEERRHISFNQRVDQCIAVDALEEEDEDDEDEYSDGNYDSGRRDEDGSSSDEEILTMKSSPRTAAAWPTMASSRNSSPGLEHQTIAKLAPTILKTSDVYPAPSPQVVDPTGFSTHFNGDATAGIDRQPGLSSQPQLYQYDNQDEEMSQTRYSQWDADDDFNGDFDYFNGPDVHDGYHAATVSQQSTDSFDDDRTIQALDSEQVNSVDRINTAPQVPRSILKRRTGSDTGAGERTDDTIKGTANASIGASATNAATSSPIAASSTHFSPPSSPDMPYSPTSSSSQNKERGRTSQRVGSSASYERLQDATRGSSSTSSSGRVRSSSATGSVYDGTNAEASSSSSPTSVGSPPITAASNSKVQHDRRESFRGRAGDGSRAMGNSGNPAARRGDGASLASVAFDGDSDGRASLDFNSPGYPASPLLGEKDGDTDSGDDDKLYGRKKDSSRWADARSGKNAHASRQRGEHSSSKLADRHSTGRSFDDDDDDEEAEEELDDAGDEGDNPSARLSVDLGNLPSNAVSPPGSAQGGPTPLNTPTFALARSRSGGKRSGGATGSVKGSATGSSSRGDASGNSGALGPSGGSSYEGSDVREPESPTVPRRSSATGALVAPSGADKDAGVRVPLAHDYVEEDEGGIVGRAVEIVNTARDLIGALLGTGGDRGRSWREAN